MVKEIPEVTVEEIKSRRVGRCPECGMSHSQLTILAVSTLGDNCFNEDMFWHKYRCPVNAVNTCVKTKPYAI